MAGQYDQLHIMINHLTKYESFRINDCRGVAFTKCSGTNGPTNERMFKPKNYMHPHYRMQGIKISLNPDAIQEALKIINQLIIHC
jgi:hypothetical protein